MGNDADMAKKVCFIRTNIKLLYHKSKKITAYILELSVPFGGKN